MIRYVIIIQAIAALFALSPNLSAQGQDWDQVKIDVQKLTSNVFVFTGQGGNIGVLVNDDHMVVIDGQYEPLFDKILAELRLISDKPVRYLLNTHWHADHVGGNARFDAEGAAIIAHDNVKSRLISGGQVEFFGSNMPPQARQALPDLTFSDEFVIDFGAEKLQVMHVANAHTDGDAIIFLPKNNVIHMGDAYFSKMFPFIDLGSGGTIKGHIAACERALALCNADTKVIPGHGAPTNADELRKYADMLTDAAFHVDKAKSGGASLKEVVDAAPEFMEKHQAEHGGGFIDTKTFISFIYNSL